MKDRKRILLYITGVLLLFFVYFYFSARQKEFQNITSFDECVAAGYPVNESYPELCVLPGKKFSNPHQKKSEESVVYLPETLPYYKAFNQNYLSKGTTVFVSAVEGDSALQKATSSVVVFNGSFYQQDFTGDFKKDIVFLAKEPNTETLYLFLGVGLYSGFAPANGFVIEKNIATSTMHVRGTSTVYVSATTTDYKNIQKTFHVEDAILKEL